MTTTAIAIEIINHGGDMSSLSTKDGASELKVDGSISIGVMSILIVDCGILALE